MSCRGRRNGSLSPRRRVFPGNGTGSSLCVASHATPPSSTKSRVLPMIRIILVDDHATLREALVVLLEREPDMKVVGEAGSVGETRQLLANKVPADVAVVPLSLPDGQGTDVVEAFLDSRAV